MMSFTDNHSLHLLSWILVHTLGLLNLNKIPVLQAFSIPYGSTSQLSPVHILMSPHTIISPTRFPPLPSWLPTGPPSQCAAFHSSTSPSRIHSRVLFLRETALTTPLLKTLFVFPAVRRSSCCISVMGHFGVITKTCLLLSLQR